MLSEVSTYGVLYCAPKDRSEGHHRPRDGVGTSGVFTEGPRISHILPYDALSAHALPHFLPWFATCCSHFPMNVDYGELRQFCDDPDDPVCPDPVWKLSRPVVDETACVEGSSYWEGSSCAARQEIRCTNLCCSRLSLHPCHVA